MMQRLAIDFLSLSEICADYISSIHLPFERHRLRSGARGHAQRIEASNFRLKFGRSSQCGKLACDTFNEEWTEQM